jgi:hypothetical protein
MQRNIQKISSLYQKNVFVVVFFILLLASISHCRARKKGEKLADIHSDVSYETFPVYDIVETVKMSEIMPKMSEIMPEMSEIMPETSGISVQVEDVIPEPQIPQKMNKGISWSSNTKANCGRYFKNFVSRKNTFPESKPLIDSAESFNQSYDDV